MPERKPPHRPEPDDADDAGFDVVDEPAAKLKPRPPRRLRAEAAEAPDPPRSARPKRKKKFRKHIPVEEDDSHERALRHFEWVVPSIVLGIGVILTIVGTVGVAGKEGALHDIGVITVGLFVSVPLTIGALMVGGILMGIEYGRVAPAILKIAAITLVVNGVLWIGDWARLPGMLTLPVACLISFGLFMTMFDLDTWETNASLGMVNGLTFIAHLIIATFLIVAESKADRKRDRGDDPDDNPPANVRPGTKGRPGPQHDPDDDP
jgi:hypothetical protein